MKVYIRQNESLESAIERLNTKVSRSGILEEYKAQMSYKTNKEKERKKEYKRRIKRAKRQNKAF